MIAAAWTRWGRTSRLHAVLACAALLAGCARLDPPALEEREQPYDQIHTATYGSVDPATRSVQPLPRSAYRPRWFFQTARAAPLPRSVPDKLHPELRLLLTTLPANQLVTIVASFTDTVAIPRMPRLDPALPRDHPANIARLDTIQSQIQIIRTRRAGQYQADTTALKLATGGRILSNYWLAQASAIEMQAGQISAFAANPNVIYVRLDRGSPAPHHDNERSNDADAARAAVGTDPYFDIGMGSGFISLIDTGVRTTHRLLWNPTRLCMVANLVTDTGTNLQPWSCSWFDPYGSTVGGGDTYTTGHGTSSAAILTANQNDLLDDPLISTSAWFRGVTRAWLDSFQAYGDDKMLSVSAAIHAFELSMERGNRVIVAEMQENEDPDIGELARIADRAYDQGTIVVAANGNEETNGLGVPGASRKVISVGQYSVQFGSATSQPKGPTPDRRVKPDVMGPSSSETASNESNAGTRYHTGTSGATPYVAGAALMMDGWLASQTAQIIDPGQVYSQLILAGNEVGSFAPNAPHGAGRIKLPPVGTAKFGKVWVSSSVASVDVLIPIAAGANVRRVDAAIWWPEKAPPAGAPVNAMHNDVNLEIRKQELGGLSALKAKSIGIDGVFERASAGAGPMPPGTWVVRIIPKTMRTGPQPVYWSVALRN